jgi:hypothetical protein
MRGCVEMHGGSRAGRLQLKKILLFDIHASGVTKIASWRIRSEDTTMCSLKKPSAMMWSV